MTEIPPIQIAALLQKIAALHERLDEVSSPKPQNAAEQRTQAMLILESIARFLRPQRGLEDRVGPILRALASALLDLNDGVTAELLRPKNIQKAASPETERSAGWSDPLCASPSHSCVAQRA